ncbi:hypothetical protein Q3C01_15990 [Bradyrhizobium sp. UFLA05-109]
MQVHVSRARDWPHATKPSLQSQRSKRQIGSLASANLSRTSIFLIATVKEFRCGLAQQLTILFLHVWPHFSLVWRAREGKENVMKKKIAEIKTTIRTTTPYTGTL